MVYSGSTSHWTVRQAGTEDTRFLISRPQGPCHDIDILGGPVVVAATAF